MAGPPEGERLLAEAGIPVFPEPLRAIRAIKALAEHGRRQRRPARAILAQPDGDVAEAVELVERARRDGARALGEHASKQVLAACGIRVTRERVATSADEAAAVADELGYPVALKVESADIPHKTEAGGVALDLRDAAEVRADFDRTMRTVRSRLPSMRIDGVLVQEMVSDGVEVLVGMTRDPLFGPTVLLGMGGVLAEVLHDTTLRIAPLDREDAEEMTRELGGAALLAGARGRPAADVRAFVDTLLRVSRLAEEAEGLQELDVNPLMVLAVGRGVVAADALVVLRPPREPSATETG
jgi:acetyltransferase